MTEQDYKEKLTAFKSSCRVYRQEKEMIEDLSSRESGGAFGNEKLLEFMKEDVAFVDKMFDRINEKCGSNARLMIWLLFVEEKTQVDVAYQYGLTRRQLQYSLNNWMHKVLDTEQ